MIGLFFRFYDARSPSVVAAEGLIVLLHQPLRHHQFRIQ